MNTKYVAYIGSYTYVGKSRGLTICDLDIENGKILPRKEVDVSNAAYIRVSADEKFLYSVTDEGIMAFSIGVDGELTWINTATIRGMRGCFIELYEEKGYMFVAGYHDGKMTVLRLREDGGVGEIVDSFYDKGMGSVAERDSIPHISCVRMTPDHKYVLAVNHGIDQVKVMRFSPEVGKIKLTDIIHCEQNSGPRSVMFHPNKNVMYMLCEITSEICVYTYAPGDKLPEFERIQKLPSLGKKHSNVNAAMRMRFSPDGKYVLVSNVGDNSVGVFAIDPEDATLTYQCCLPISGRYPKDCGLFPGGKTLYSVNFEEGTLTTFTMDYEKKCFAMNAAPVPIDQPNCCAIVKVETAE